MTEIIVRGGEHDGYSRLVFDWEDQVEYRLQRRGTQLMIIFSGSGRLNTDQLETHRLGRISAVAQMPDEGGLTVAVSIPVQSYRFTHSRMDRRVILDIHSAETVFSPLPEPYIAPVSAEESESGQAESEISEQGLSDNLENVLTRLQAGTHPLPLRHSLRTGPQIATIYAEGTEDIADETNVSTEDGSKDGEGVENTERDALPVFTPSLAPDKALFSETHSEIRVDIAPQGGIAVFYRAGYLWLVTEDDAAEIQPAIGPASEDLRLGQVVAATEGGRAWAWPVPTEVQVSISRGAPSSLSQRYILRLSLDEKQNRTEGELRFETGGEPPQTIAEIVLSAPTRPVRFRDPRVGDYLVAIPVQEKGQALTRAHRLLEFEILPAEMGAVIRPLPPPGLLKIERRSGRILIFAPEGLMVTPESDHELVALYARLRDEEHRLLPVTLWRYGRDGEKQDEILPQRRRDMEIQAARLPPEERFFTAMDQARLHLSFGLGLEALAYLELALAPFPDLMDDPEWVAMRGMALAIAGRHGQALAELRRAALEDYNDLSVWRGLAYAGLGDWNTAHKEYQRGWLSMLALPDELFVRAAPMAAEASFYVGDYSGMREVIEAMRARVDDVFIQKARLDYLESELLYHMDEKEAAQEIWLSLLRSDNFFVRIRATLRLTDELYRQGELTAEEAIARLDRVRYLWRGDSLEFALLRRMAEIYIKEKMYREGLYLLDEAVNVFAGSAEARDLAAEQARIFRLLFVEGQSDTMPALEVVALWEEFKHLSPLGQEREAVYERVAARYRETDLLRESVQLLKEQALFTQDTARRTRIGAEAAAINLMLRRAQPALDILNETEILPMDPALFDERRLLRAKALADLGRTQQALDILAPMQGELARRARVEIAWAGRNWAIAAAELAELSPPIPTEGSAADLSETGAQIILNRAIALALDGDSAALARLRRDYRLVLMDSKVEQAFNLVTRPGSDNLMQDIATVRSQAEEVSMYQQFLARYRQAVGLPLPRLPQEPVSVEQSEAAERGGENG